MSMGVYIHIPFCGYKCHFCDFVTSTGKDEFQAQYCDVLKREIFGRLDADNKPVVNTIFYGGGTPGILDINELSQIHQTLLDNIQLNENSEISFETTPETVTKEKAKAWRELGINRLSIGIESFIDKELATVGRGHTADQAIKAIEIASQTGFNNINCDLIYGLPGQSLDSWKASLSTLIRLAKQFDQIKHVSAYSLELSPAAPLSKLFPAQSSIYPSEEVFEKQLQYLIQILAESGFKQYEISNFAKQGYESRHNMNYWLQGEYHAFGVSSHRYLKPYRSSNWRSLQQYLTNYLTNETCELINKDIAQKEAIMLSLRMTEGINLKRFEQLFNLDLVQTYNKQIEKLLTHNLIEYNDEIIKLTRAGQPVANSVIAEFW